MRKFVFAIAITALFFFVGRSKYFVATTLTDYQPLTQLKAIQTNYFKAAQTTKQEHKQTSNPQSIPKEQTKTAEQTFLTSVDSELFNAVYSQEFQTNWKKYLPTFHQRLFSELPDAKQDPISYDKEVVARLGLLKSLNTATNAENDDDLKHFLFSYLEFSRSQPWPLQREALHTLIEQNDLDQTEEQTAMKFLDARTRNTASVSDQELLDQAVEGLQ